MTFVILVIWCLVSALAIASKEISAADMYIGMTILLAAEYIEWVIERKK
jgi:hypothetical protein